MNSGMGYGFWPAAILMIVLASWVLYRYAAPEGWREWKGAGLVQAFIIALYAEMYGFPLTLYALTGVFGVDIPMAHPSGHLWSALLGYGMIGGTIEMLLGYAFVLFGIGLLAMGWREVYKARQDEHLATGRLYGLVRASSVHGHLYRPFRAAHSLADDHYGGAFPGDRVGVRSAGPHGRTRND